MREYIKSNTNDKGVSLSLSLLSLQPHESTAAAGQTICAWQCGWHSPNEGAASEDDEKRPASHLNSKAHFINVTQRTQSATTYASIDVIHISKPRPLLLLLLSFSHSCFINTQNSASRLGGRELLHFELRWRKRATSKPVSRDDRAQQTFHIFIFYEYIIYQLILYIFTQRERKQGSSSSSSNSRWRRRRSFSSRDSKIKQKQKKRWYRHQQGFDEKQTLRAF